MASSPFDLIKRGMSGIINEGKSFLTPKTNKQAGITDYSNLGIARNTIMEIPKTISRGAIATANFLDPRRPVTVRTPFDNKETQLPYGGGLVQLGANMPSRYIEAIPKVATQFAANVAATKGKDVNMSQDNAARLGLTSVNGRIPFTAERYAQSDASREWMKNPTLKSFGNAVLESYKTFGLDVLDVLMAGQATKILSNAVINNVKVPPPEIQEAWVGLGKPQTIREAQKIKNSLLIDLSNETRGFSTGGSDVASNINTYYKALEKFGIPSAPSKFAQGARNVAEALNTDVKNILDIGKQQFAYVKPAGYLPGQATIGKPQPSVGLSTRPIRKVGAAYPEAVQNKALELEFRSEALNDSPFNFKDNRFLVGAEGLVRELGDLKSPKLIRIYEDQLAQSGINDPTEYAEGLEKYFEDKKALDQEIKEFNTTVTTKNPIETVAQAPVTTKPSLPLKDFPENPTQDPLMKSEAPQELNNTLRQTFGESAVPGIKHKTDIDNFRAEDFAYVSDRGYPVAKGFANDPFMKDMKKALLSPGMSVQNLRSALTSIDGRTAKEIAKNGTGSGFKLWHEVQTSLAAKQDAAQVLSEMAPSLNKSYNISVNSKKDMVNMVDALENRLPKNSATDKYYKAVEEVVRPVYDSLYKLLNETSIRAGKGQVGYVKDYATMKAAADYQKNITKYNDFNDYLARGPFSPYTKKRTGIMPRGIREMRFDKLFDAYANSVLNQVYTAPIVDKLSAVSTVLKDRGFDNAVKLLDSINKQAFKKDVGVIDSALGLERGNWIRAGLTGYVEAKTSTTLSTNFLWTATTQPLSYLNLTVPLVGPKYATEGLYSAFRLTKADKALIARVKETPTYKLKTGAKIGMTGAGDIDVSGLHLAGNTREQLRDVLNMMADEMESELTIASAIAGYKQGLSLGMSEADAMMYGEYIAETSQSAYNPEARPQLLQNVTVRSVAPFQTYAAEMNRFAQTIILNQGGIPTKGAREKLARALLLISTTMMSLYILKKVKGQSQRVATTFIPVVGETIDRTYDTIKSLVTGKEGFYDEEENILSGVGPVGDFETIKEAFTIWHETGETSSLRRALVFWSFGTMGLGGAQVNRTIDGVIDNIRGYHVTKEGQYGYPIEGISDRIIAPIMGPGMTGAATEAYREKTAAEKILDNLKPKSDKEILFNIKKSQEAPRPGKPMEDDRSSAQLVIDYVKAAGKDFPNFWRALTTPEKLGLVEGNLVELERMYGVYFKAKGGSEDYKKWLMANEGIPWSERDNWKMEHIVPVKAGGTSNYEDKFLSKIFPSQRKNLYIISNAEHDYYTDWDNAAADAIKKGDATRGQLSDIARRLKLDKSITVEQAIEEVNNL